jgi:hypothetical protein
VPRRKKQKKEEEEEGAGKDQRREEEERRREELEASWYRDRERAGRKKERRRRKKKKKKKEEEGRAEKESREKNKKIKPKKANRPKYTYRPKHPEIHRNGRNTPKHPEILPEVEWGVVSYRFAYRYEIFRPFRPERNGIYNYGLPTSHKGILGFRDQANQNPFQPISQNLSQNFVNAPHKANRPEVSNVRSIPLFRDKSNKSNIEGVRKSAMLIHLLKKTHHITFNHSPTFLKESHIKTIRLKRLIPLEIPHNLNYLISLKAAIKQGPIKILNH